jgi:putative transposase
MNEKRKFSSEQKAQVILEVLREELSVIEIGKKYEITPRLIYEWKEVFLEKSKKIFDTKNVESSKDKKIKHYEHVISKITTQNDFLEKVLAVMK